MRKYYSLFSAVIITAWLFVSPCFESSVVAAIFPVYDWVREISEGTGTSITLLLNSGADLHSYQPSAKDIVLKGYCETVHDDATGKDYYGVILMDGSMCCSVGVDFVLKPSYKYPETGAVITVMGRFEQYKDGEDTFCRLSDAELL